MCVQGWGTGRGVSCVTVALQVRVLAPSRRSGPAARFYNTLHCTDSPYVTTEVLKQATTTHELVFTDHLQGLPRRLSTRIT